MKRKSMTMTVPKSNDEKCEFYLARIKPVGENAKTYLFMQEDANIVTLEWKLQK